MKKTYAIEVDCAACANKMEVAAGRIEGVKEVSVQFITQKMTVEFGEGADVASVMRAVEKACRRIEPDCEIDWK